MPLEVDQINVILVTDVVLAIDALRPRVGLSAYSLDHLQSEMPACS